jgi:hypothetical protein
MTGPALRHTSDRKLIQELVNHYQQGSLNLEPGFQRDSVWREKDRAKLIDSIVRNYPLPAIFLYRRHEDGQLVYDVIDGKQRLESVFMFMGIMRGRFWAKVPLPSADGEEWMNWKRFCKKRLQHLITGYSIPTIEVDGEFTDIVDVFVRINSTGKALTPQEKRHARYYDSAFLKEANRIAKRYENKFFHMGVLSATDISRMKHVELISELMLSMHRGDVLNKKTALDSVMSSDGLNARDIRKSAQQTVKALNRVWRMFPRLYTTRFRRITDFYSLTVMIGRYEQEGYILTDRRRNRLAWDLLTAFGSKVDEMREKQRQLQGAKPDEEIYRTYLMTVSQITDDVSQRRKREEILKGILGSLFARKDSQRGFTPEQRRIIWNSSTVHRCSGARCGGRILTWRDFTLDHIRPHTKGGRSELANAKMMCQECNSAKGHRRR